LTAMPSTGPMPLTWAEKKRHDTIATGSTSVRERD
jgi:hypothetical protein